MKTLCVLVFTAMAGLQLCQAQQNLTDCTAISTDLGTMPIDPVTNPNLPVCVDQRGQPQCCTPQFIMQQLSAAQQNFREGLRIELVERFQEFHNIADKLRQFLTRDFLTSYFRSIGNLSFVGGGIDELITGFIKELHDSIEPIPGAVNQTNGFNAQDFLTSVLEAIEKSAGLNLGGRAGQLNATDCVIVAIKNHIKNQNVEAQAQSLEQIQRVMASFDLLQAFIRNFTTTLVGFSPLPQCVDTLVRLNTCGRCTGVRPSFCENVCEAIANACYSPFNDAITSQLAEFWGVVKMMLKFANESIVKLNTEKGLLDRAAIVNQISADCNINIGGGQSPIDNDVIDELNIPVLPVFELLQTANEVLSGGPFDYSGRDTYGPGLCRRFNTSDSNCWDGSMVLEDDIESFSGTTIKDQVNNPVIKITEQDLNDQAVALGKPVTNLIEGQAFSQVAPLGLVLNGAPTMVLSITSLLLMLLASSLLI